MYEENMPVPQFCPYARLSSCCMRKCSRQRGEITTSEALLLGCHAGGGFADQALLRKLEYRQFGLKMIANVTYGYHFPHGCLHTHEPASVWAKACTYIGEG